MGHIRDAELCASLPDDGADEGVVHVAERGEEMVLNLVAAVVSERRVSYKQLGGDWGRLGCSGGESQTMRVLVEQGAHGARQQPWSGQRRGLLIEM